MPALSPTDILLSAAIATSFLAAGWLPVRRLGSVPRSVRWLVGFVAVEALALLAGYVLSGLGRLDDPLAWVAAGVIACGLAGLVSPVLGRSLEPKADPDEETVEETDEAVPGERWLTRALLAAALVQIVVLVWSAPGHWDSLGYHLPRAAYALQSGTLDRFDANYWAQVDHPKNATVLVLLAMQVGGRTDALAELPQFVSWLVTAVAAYVAARALGLSRSTARMAAALFGLATHALTQAVTVQSDPLVTANLAVAVALVARASSLRAIHLVIPAGLAIGIAAGVKATAIVALPAVAGALWWACSGPARWRQRGLLGASAIVGVALFALPAGYRDNYRVHGHPLGSEHVRQAHTFVDIPLSERALATGKNAIRFAVDAASTESRWLGSLDRLVRKGYAAALAPLGLDDDRHTRQPFVFHRPPGPLPDYSYCGLVLPLIFLPALGYLLLRWRQTPPLVRWSAIGVLVFWLTQSAVGPYDPWRSRYFTIATWLATLPAAWWIQHAAPRRWLLLAAGILLFTTADALQHGNEGRLLSKSYGSRLAWSRLEQMTVADRRRLAPFRQYQARVPADASVVVAVPPDSLEYLAFGSGPLHYRLIPCGTNEALREHAAEAQFALVHQRRAAPWPGAHDLGAGYWLWRNPAHTAGD